MGFPISEGFIVNNFIKKTITFSPFFRVVIKWEKSKNLGVNEERPPIL
jgi:hypothetical protein